MPDASSCAICKGPLIGRMPAIINGKPAYVCARCGSAPRVGAAPPKPMGQALAPPDPGEVTEGPARCGLCVGPRGVTEFLNRLLRDNAGARVQSMCQSMVGAFKSPEPTSPENGGPEAQQGALPVMMVTVVLEMPEVPEAGADEAPQGVAGERQGADLPAPDVPA